MPERPGFPACPHRPDRRHTTRFEAAPESRTLGPVSGGCGVWAEGVGFEPTRKLTPPSGFKTDLGCGPLVQADQGERQALRALAHKKGRTSTLRLQAHEPSAASLRAASRSGASMIQRPPRYSFDSAKGPSMTS